MGACNYSPRRIGLVDYSHAAAAEFFEDAVR
jgi:hypothetical protein